MEQQPQTTLPVIISKPESIVKIIQENLPKMQSSHDKAVEALSAMQKATTEEEYTANNELLAKCKITYDYIKKFREVATKPMDEAKDFLMKYERPLDYSTTAKGLYADKRRLQEDYQNEQLAKRREEERKAVAQKEKANHIIDLITQIKKNLNALIQDKILKADEFSRNFFENVTVEQFDEKAKQFMSFKPKLDEKDWSGCFSVQIKEALLPSTEWLEQVAILKDEENLAKWNEKMLEAIMPTLNEWRAKVPEIKQQKLQLQNAKNEEEALQIQKAQAAKEEQERERKKRETEDKAKEEEARLADEADRNKLENAFREQAVMQELPSAGNVKQILKFESFDKMPKALMEIIFQCFANGYDPYKREKSGKKVLDAQGREQYNLEVQKWLDFFVKKVDAHAPAGCVWFEDAKVTVRK